MTEVEPERLPPLLSRPVAFALGCMTGVTAVVAPWVIVHHRLGRSWIGH